MPQGPADPPAAPAPKPRYFLSAVSPEFRTLRKKADEVLRFLGYEVETMEIWGTGPGDLRERLREKIDGCDGLIQIVGEGYGAEPPTPDPELGRLSYTQYEFRHAEREGKKTWLLFAGPGAFRDTPVERLDLPPEGHPDPTGYQAERRDRQAAYRAGLRQGGHLRHRFETPVELENLILRLREDSERLRREFREWQGRLTDGQRSAARWIRALVAAAAVAVLAGGGAVWWMHDDSRAMTDGQTRQIAQELTQQLADLDIQKAKAQGRAERDYREAKERAGRLSDADARQRELARLQSEHRYRLEAIDRLFEMLRTGYSQGEINDITAEFQRLLEAPPPRGGIDPALAYLRTQEPDLLAEYQRRAERRDEAERQARAMLRSLLVAAAAAASEDRATAAARLYEQVLEKDPRWAEALQAAGWFYQDRAGFEAEHGTLDAALPLARKAVDYAQRLAARPPVDAASQRLRAVADSRLADILVTRGQPGDAEQALAAYLRCNEFFERQLKDNPSSAQAARDVSVSLERIADLLAVRGQPGDGERALEYSRRGLEISEGLLKSNPQSAQAARDVSVSLNKLAGLLAVRGQPGDGERALEYSRRGLEIREGLLKSDPRSARAARDLSVSYSRMAMMAERSGSRDATDWWRKAYGILDGMKREGRFVSKEDEAFLEALRRKIAP